MKKYFIKIALTFFLGIASFYCFTVPVKSIRQNEIQVSKNLKQNFITEKEGLKNYLEYIGLFLLVIAAWQWRKELEFDAIGIISKSPDVQPTDPNNRKTDDGDAPPPQPINPPIIPGGINVDVGTDVKSFIHQDKLNQVLLLMNNNPYSIINAQIISNKLGISLSKTQDLLYELMMKGLIRRDTYPGNKSSIYSLANSLDNLAINYFINKKLSNKDVVGDYRYVRINNQIEIDAIIKTSKTNYIVELKFIRQDYISVIKRGIQQLLKVEEIINLEPINLVLIIVAKKEILQILEQQEYALKQNMILVPIDIENITTPNTA